jgi:septal ring factor EnvC (AmiA/AmiB activator)
MDRQHKTPNNDPPATQADLSLLAGEMTRRFDDAQHDVAQVRDEVKHIRQSVETVNTRIHRLEQGQQTLLEVVQSIDERLKQSRRLPERVARLERTVFPR